MSGGIYPLGHTGFPCKWTYMETYKPFGLLSKSNRQDVVVNAFCGCLPCKEAVIAATQTRENIRGNPTTNCGDNCRNHIPSTDLLRTDLWEEEWVTGMLFWLTFLWLIRREKPPPQQERDLSLPSPSPGFCMGLPGAGGWALLPGRGFCSGEQWARLSLQTSPISVFSQQLPSELESG